ncbi:MAG: hypothetical protein AVDCRST_MAG26-2083, partial [uncultured Chloroflexia bacterium]
ECNDRRTSPSGSRLPGGDLDSTALGRLSPRRAALCAVRRDAGRSSCRCRSSRDPRRHGRRALRPSFDQRPLAQRD